MKSLKELNISLSTRYNPMKNRIVIRVAPVPPHLLFSNENIINTNATIYSTSSTTILLFRKLKRVYTSDGIFYLYFNKRRKTFHLYKDNFFYLQGISYNNYSDNENGIMMDPIKIWVKKQVDVLYEEKRYMRRINDSIDKWSGDIDKQTERDRKINKVLN